MKVVLYQGALEIINNGHIRCMRLAKSQGDYLIVALNSNKLLPKYKNRVAVVPWKQKAEILRSIRYVDKVVEARNFSPMGLLKKWKVKVYMVADEWIAAHPEELAYMKSIGGRVVIMPRYKGVVCTSEIKRRLLAEAKGV